MIRQRRHGSAVPPAPRKSRSPSRIGVLLGWATAATLVAAVFPQGAQAHTGPANPVASSYVAKLTGAPAGVQPRVLGGDLRMWLLVPPGKTVIVLDYHGAPYLRFTAAGVDVNANSWMYYLNQPTPLTPPRGLTPTMQPNWQRVSFGHQYSWHDGRLHALASVALTPGQKLVGSWRIPLRVDGSPTAISGVLVHADDPSIVWFWPIAVVLLCLWAISRLGRREVDRVTAYVLAVAALAGIAVLAIGHELYGEPFVSVGQEIVLSVILAFVAAMFILILLRGPGPFSLILIAVGSLWAGLEFLPTLLHGFVLMTVPDFVARVATVTCLACGVGVIVLLFVFRLADTPEQAGETTESARERELDPRESLA